MSDEIENDDNPTLSIVIDEGWLPEPTGMIVVKRLINGDVHAENSDGEMVIVRTDGVVKTFLDGDTEWVTGRKPSNVSAWEVVGFHFHMTDGAYMDRTRNERTN